MTADNVIKIIEDNQEEVRKYAEQILEKAKKVQELTKKLHQIQQGYNQINKHIKKLKEAMKSNSNDQTIKDRVEQYEATKTIFKEIGKKEASKAFQKNIQKAILDLQTAIHSFQKFFGSQQGQTFVLQYVVYNRGQPKIYQIPFEKAISVCYEGLSHGFVSRINFSQKRLQDLIKEQQQENEKIKQITKDIENLYEHNMKNKERIDEIYSLAYQRFQKSKDKTIFINLHQEKQIKFTINNKGDLAEGYLRFLYKIQKFSSTKNDKEQDLFEFITKGVVPVTNQSGFFLDDITFKGKQIGSKFGSAQALQSEQIVKLAQQILNLLNKKISKQSLKDFLNKEPFFHGAQRNGLKDEINGGAKIYAQEEIKKYLENLFDNTSGVNIT